MWNQITANIRAQSNTGLDLQLSLLLDGLLMAIIAVPNQASDLHRGFESNPVPEVAPKSFYLTRVSLSITQQSLWGQ